MILKRTFVFGHDPDYGNDGWKPAWIHQANAFPAESVPHDILEHTVTHPDQAVDELLALGSSIYVRTKPGWYYWKNPISSLSPAEHLGSTLHVDVLRAHDGGQILRPGRTQACEGDTEIDEALDACLTYLRDDAPLDGCDRHLRDWARVTRPRMRGWLRKGYRRAQRAYKVLGPHRAMQLYDDLGKALARRESCEGDRIEIVVNTSTGKFRIHEEYDPYDQ